ncbi:hypothetical protein [Orientia tsutsugamushi]|uniref:hypothetical protein n=1 Tax=Orientia tsutsugamushi TaxID=784 RepID=UPI000D5A323B|nr:Uncharacterised protein [Orientia tsutsugamushi]
MDRPKRTAAEAIETVTIAAINGKTRVIDADLHSYFDTITHHDLFNKAAKRVNDKDVMKLLKLIQSRWEKRNISMWTTITSFKQYLSG